MNKPVNDEEAAATLSPIVLAKPERRKVRYVAGWAMFKVKACSCKYISQYAGSKDKKVLAKVKEERLIKDFLDDGMISTRESVLRETAYPDSLKHIELHNRGALVHVTDAVFLFFVQLEICCKRILKKNLITMHNKDAVSVARNLMKNDFSVKRAWESMFQNKVTKAIGGILG